MANFLWDGLSTQSQAFNPALDTLVIGSPGDPIDAFEITRLYTNDNATGVIVRLSNGFSFTMVGPVVEQLTDANIDLVFGDFDIGDNGPNFLTGTLVVGLGGNDDIESQNGTNGFLQGNQGDDDIDGNGDNDATATNMDRIRGGKGNDDIYDFGTGSIVHGDQNDDDIYAEDDADGVTIFGGNGDVPFDPLDGADDIEGSNGSDWIQGNGGNDDIYAQDGDDIVRGGKGDDDIYGEDDNDWLSGDLGNDHVHGGYGDDSIFGGEGTDELDGDKGDDWIEGGIGNDEIDGDKGADLMTGGAGQDIFSFYDDGDNVPTPFWDNAAFDGEGIRQENFTGNEAIFNNPQNIGIADYTTAGRFGLFDNITDLDLGTDNALGTVDRLAFQGWSGGDLAVTDLTSASNLGQILTEASNTLDPDLFGDELVIVDVGGTGGFGGRSFMLVEVDGNNSGWDYLIEVTDWTGDLDSSDILDTPI